MSNDPNTKKEVNGSCSAVQCSAIQAIFQKSSMGNVQSLSHSKWNAYII